MAFKFTCPQCGHTEYMSGFSYGRCSACGWKQEVGDIDLDAPLTDDEHAISDAYKTGFNAGVMLTKQSLEAENQALRELIAELRAAAKNEALGKGG